MLCRNPRVDERQLVRLVQDRYDESVSAVEFVPVGRDSWCYRSETLWVNVRRDWLGHVPRAYEAAAGLRASGLEFVLAPLLGVNNAAVQSLHGLPVVAFPYVAAQRGAVPASAVVGALNQLHEREPPAGLPVDTLDALPADGLDSLLAGLPHVDPAVGPYAAEAVHALVESADLLRLVAAGLRRASDHLRSSPASGGSVLTHGEPSLANAIVVAELEVVLCDWGGLAVGPPDRDWFHVERTLGVNTPLRPEFRDYYARRWLLTEVVEYGIHLTHRHGGSADDSQMLLELGAYLADASQLI